MHSVKSALHVLLLSWFCSIHVVAQPASWFEHGQAAFYETDYEEALAALDQVTEHAEAYRESQYLLAIIYQDTWLQDREKAAYYLTQAEALFTDQLRAAEIALRKRRLKEPEAKAASLVSSLRRKYAKRLLRMNPQHALALDERGLEAYHMDKPAKAESLYTAALTSNPQQRSSYIGLMRLFVKEREYKKSERVLAQMQQHLSNDPLTWSYTGMLHYKQRRLREAEASFALALQRMPAQELAAFKNMDVFLPDDTEARLDTASLWEAQDPRLLTPENERQLEHYARMVYADLYYAMPSSGLRGWQTDRGQFIVRYGVPLHTRNSANMEYHVTNAEEVWSTPNRVFRGEKMETRAEDWMYSFGMFRFSDPYRTNEYRLHTPSAAAPLSPRGTEQRIWKTDYEIEARNQFRETPHQFDYEPPGARVELPYLVSTLKGADGQVDIVVPLGVQVPYKPKRGDLTLGLRTGAFLVSSTEGVVGQQRRSATVLKGDQVYPFREITLWTDVHQLTSGPGSYQVAVEFETESGAIVGQGRSELIVPDYNDTTFRMSDIVLAYRVEEDNRVNSASTGYVQRKGLTIQPAPWGVYNTSQPLYFYFETYNLTQQPDGATRYRVEAVLVEHKGEKNLNRLIQRAFGRKQRMGVSVAFDGSGMQPSDGQYLIVDTEDQEPGNYVLVVRIEDLISGERVEAQRTLILE